MPTVAETAFTIQERVGEIPPPNVLQSSGEFYVNRGLEANLQTQGQTPEVTGATTPTPDKERMDGIVLPELPPAHSEVDVATISVWGLIKKCRHFAEMHKIDPERAEAEAAKTVQQAQEASALREQGMSDKEINAKMMADNLARAKEKAKAVSKDEKTKVEQKAELKSEPVTVIKPAEPELSKPILQDKQAEIVRSIQQERQQNEKPLSVVSSVVPVAEFLAVRRRAEQDKAHQEVTAKRLVVSVKDKQHTISQEQPLREKPENWRLPSSQSSTTSAQKLVPEVSSTVYGHEVPTTTDVIQADFQQATNEVNTHTNETDGAKESNVETDEQLALQFEPEVIDTYKELISLLENEICESYEFNESAVELEDTTDALVVEAISLQDTSQDFETFLALQPEAEEDVPLETIIEQADRQPLEQTLVQLAQYISDTLQEGQGASEVSADALPELSDKRIELNTILQEIAEILPTCYYVDEETQEKRIQITPEMTQKLLRLFRSLGYEQPREVLVEFVRLHGLGFLLQAVKYMHQLSNTDERQEFYASSPMSKSIVDENEQLRLGKILFGLIMHKPGFILNPEYS